MTKDVTSKKENGAVKKEPQPNPEKHNEYLFIKVSQKSHGQRSISFERQGQFER